MSGRVDKQAALKQIDEGLSRYADVEKEYWTSGGQTGRGYIDAPTSVIAEVTTTLQAIIERLGLPNYGKEALKGIPERPGWESPKMTKLAGIVRALRDGYEAGTIQGPKGSDIPAFLQIEKLLTRFHQVAKQLEKRYASRDSLRIGDEYDVQNLLHALLRIDFDDIRPEEWTPSYAGKSAKMDFLLKGQRIVIEVKKTGERHAERETGDELLVDIARYQTHPDCDTLVCFLYDPEQRIGNPVGFKTDLELASTDKLAVAVIICQH